MIDVRSLTKTFRVKKRRLNAVKDVTFQIEQGEILGLVGESGCGKSTLARLLVRLENPTSGQILFEGNDIKNTGRELYRNVQMVFQDPFSSLNPRMTVEDILCEPLRIHKLPTHNLVEELLELVGLDPHAKRRYPHEFSGGQRQRIGIARALALKPKFLICDEPISSLDVSIASQIAALLQRLQRELKLTILFITHDLAWVRKLAHRIAVMYFGSIVEIAPTEELFSAPQHPYTQLLLNSIPIPDPILERQRPRPLILGEPPSPTNPPSGCPFSNQCPHAKPICKLVQPPLLHIGQGRSVACHLHSDQSV